MILQSIHNIAEICAQLGVREAILSPGSRCAPITVSFSRHPSIETRVITDERSAGFIAFGMAQYLGRPVITVCTSGTAVLNHSPSVAEAFYQKVPMVLITADRPPEWTDQQDGQAIRQNNIFGAHVKRSYQLPDHYGHPDVKWHLERTVSEAVNESREYPPGPVHINVPLREPFYPDENEDPEYSEDVRSIQIIDAQPRLEPESWEPLASAWNQYKKILILGGQRNRLPEANQLADIQVLANHYPLVGDVISNLHCIEDVITHSDIFLFNGKNQDLEQLQPDLLVTFGHSVISKNLKNFLRKHPAKDHWHIQPFGQVADTFQCLSHVIRTDEDFFFKRAVEWIDDSQGHSGFHMKWYEYERQARLFIDDFASKIEFGELQAMTEVIEALPSKANLHLSNSMPVRLANFIGLNTSHPQIRVVSNRGTSGIDGSNGTAVGEALVSDEPVILVTGDLAFFYDRNAFWHSYDLSKLKIVLLNNHAGGIFGMIDGPSGLPELEEYFETHQPLNAERTAADFGFEYFFCDSLSELKSILDNNFFGNINGPAVLEIKTSNDLNKSIYRDLKKEITSKF